MRRISFLAVALVAAAPLALVLAQNPAQPQPGAQPRQPGVAQPQQNLDPMLANCLIIDNQEEVAINQMAQDKAQNEKVKEFAQKMIEDHTQFISKLDRFAPGASRQMLRIDQTTTTERRTETDRPDANRPDRNPAANPDAKRGEDDKARDNDAKARDNANPNQANPNQADPNQANRNPNQPAAGQVQRTEQTTTTQIGAQGAMMHPNTFLAMKRELAQECLKSLSKEFNEKSGKEFDECFMVHQAMMHQKMVVTLTVFSRHASPALKPVLEEGLQTAEMHLKHAKDLVKSLDGEAKTASGEKATKKE